MLESITLHNFKAFQSQQIALKPLTLLTGLNGMGKSTVIQALLLLRQSYQEQVLKRDHHLNSGLVRNGDWVQMGTGFDILNENAAKDMIELGLAVNSLGAVLDGNDLWARSGEWFPNLIFCENARRQIQTLHSGTPQLSGTSDICL